MIKKIITEPLFHFFLIGLAIFGLYNFVNPASEDTSNRTINIDENVINRLSQVYEQNWKKTPDSTQLQQLIALEVKMEIFYREALRMNLEHSDEIVRRRLSQKYEFLMKDLVEIPLPTEKELADFYNKNKKNYKAPVQYSFAQIYFNPDKRKNAKKDAETVLKSIAQNVKNIDLKTYGDPFFLPTHFQNEEYHSIRQQLGVDFTKALFEKKELGWQAPIASGYGIHLVKIDKMSQTNILPLEKVKSQVAEDWNAQKMSDYNEALYQNLLKKYTIIEE